jgi:hypothetical protein
MRGADGLAEAGWREAQRWAALSGGATASDLCSRPRLRADTSAHRTPGASESAQTPRESDREPGIDGLRSRPATCRGLRSRLIREKIIGHGLSSVPAMITRGTSVHCVPADLGLLHEASSQHGHRVFLQPLIQQNRNLLSKIGGVGQPRQFIGLQGISRSGQQELPGRLGLVMGHRSLRFEAYGNTVVKGVQEYLGYKGLWKNVENFCGSTKSDSGGGRAEGAVPDEVRIAGPAMRTCSACAGDYEDPDRTAGSDDELMDEDGERELDECDADGNARSENEARATRRRIDAVPEGFMTGE